uniref:Sex-regulated protein janus-B n=2 Tax=Ascaris TaxID=6251 RepID=F1L613_ASCSU
MSKGSRTLSTDLAVESKSFCVPSWWLSSLIAILSISLGIPVLFLLKSRNVSSSLKNLAMPLSSIADVDIDPQGVFKYILIKVTEKASNEEKLIVRGYKRCHFHGDVFEETENAVGSDFNLKCLGGGRIRHEPDKREILVYGYSQGYGPADHQKSVNILKTKYPDYKITFSNEGY